MSRRCSKCCKCGGFDPCRTILFLLIAKLAGLVNEKFAAIFILLLLLCCGCGFRSRGLCCC